MAFFKYFENEEFNFQLEEKDFVTIMGTGNERIINNLYNVDKNEFLKINYMSFKNIDNYKMAKRLNVILNENLDFFICSTVEEEIRYVLENLGYDLKKINENIKVEAEKYELSNVLKCNPTTIGSSNRVKLKVLLTLIMEPRVIVLDNVIEQLDNNDKNFIIRLLKKYSKDGNLVINFTNDIEESLYGNKIILTSENKIIAEGKTLSILNEEKLLKKLGLGLPFCIELSSILTSYELIDKYYTSLKKLVNKLCK